MYRIGIDLGGTNIAVGVVDDGHAIVSRVSVPTMASRPAAEVVRDMGGLHKFMRWDGPMLTDSGGFQVFSLSGLRKIKEEGVTFASHIDGRRIFMGPEESMQIQSNLGSDVAMAFDECIENPSPREYVERSCARTTRWLERCVAEHKRLTEERLGKPYQALYGVVQGANYEDLRRHAAEQIASLDFDGVGIGGAIEKRIIGDTCAWICDAMPESRPRHVLGIAAVDDIFACVENGGDTFDCVAPARCGRNGAIFTRHGRYNIKRAQFKHDFGPLEEGCDCYTCTHYSRAYVDHALRAREFNGFTLATIHNEREAARRYPSIDRRRLFQRIPRRDTRQVLRERFEGLS